MISKEKLSKYSGAGNTFLMFDNIEAMLNPSRNEVKAMMQDYGDIDGLILLEESDTADYKMNYYNRDGSSNTLCGNGLRCTAQFVKDALSYTKDTVNIEAAGSKYECTYTNTGVKVKFPPPKILRPEISLKVHYKSWWKQLRCSFVDCGSPHLVINMDELADLTDSIDKLDVPALGKILRNHPELMPEGANVNFIQELSGNHLKIRSYERGVEGETLACGTGAVSAALVHSILSCEKPPITLTTRSVDDLIVDFKLTDNEVSELSLEGLAVKLPLN